MLRGINADYEPKFASQQNQTALNAVGGREQTVLETMGTTLSGLEAAESKLSSIHGYLFGPEIKQEDCCGPDANVMSVRSIATDSFACTMRLNKMADEIKQRLAEGSE